MSLFTDLKAVLTPYANKIKSLGTRILTIETNLNRLTRVEDGTEDNPVDYDTMLEPSKYIIYSTSFTTNGPIEAENKGVVLTVTKEKSVDSGTPMVFQECVVPSTGEKFCRFMFYSAKTKSYPHREWTREFQFSHGSIDAMLMLLESSAYSDAILTDKVNEISKYLPINTFDPLTAARVRGFIRITDAVTEAVINNYDQAGYNVYIGVKPNTKYRIGKLVSDAFRVTFLSERPVPSTEEHTVVKYSILSTQANHSGISIRVTSPAEASYMLIQYLNDADAYSEEEIRNSINVIVV